MAVDRRDELQRIRTFPALVAYLRDELGWPIETDDFDELMFEYTPDELGIDHASAAQIKKIMRLRPLTPTQPWGIFFVEFEPKQLPVVALRRILSRVVLKKRASANSADRTAWAADDLLFVSNYGRSAERQISFAHFSQEESRLALPVLKVLGWDDQDTQLHLDHIVGTLHEHLSWPADDGDVEAWRTTWRGAFTLRHREVVSTSKTLAVRLAALARSIRDRIAGALAIETDDGPLTRLMDTFREALVHDLGADGFADMYAQTIAYGLLSARIADPRASTVDDFAGHMRTNPFLRELMESFLSAGGSKNRRDHQTGIDFDELGINEVIELLDNANMDAVLRDFGDRNPQEDPVIHFYELFLKEYDAEKKVQRGVFYTPRPVVVFIVKSVDELLREEFGLPDGLADTATWGDMIKRHDGLRLPDRVDADDPFVQILDPAAGTGTFLVEVIDLVYRQMTAKWKSAGSAANEIDALWNEYVPAHLLPRLHGYELLMAPYAIAHLKIGLKLYETGYRFGSDARARVYLTNALEPPHEFADRLAFAIPALAHEAEAVDAIKRDQHFTVVLGNPPYSGHSWNLTPELRRIVEPYRFVDGQRIKEKGALQLEKSIQDDYIKFIRAAEQHVVASTAGVVGLVTSHGFLDNPFLRGMRSSVLSSFSKLFVLDLHGNGLRGEKAPDGSADKNVFDINRTGAAISLLRRVWGTRGCDVLHADLWGGRETKYPWLIDNTVLTTSTESLEPKAPSYVLLPQDTLNVDEYERGYSVAEIMPVYSKGCVTGRDAFDIDFDTAALTARMEVFARSKMTDTELVEQFRLNPSEWWNVRQAREAMPSSDELQEYVRPILYRPFDIRPCFYHPAVFMSPRRPVMRHMEPEYHNILLVTSRMTKGEPFQHVTVAEGLAEAILLSSKTSNNAMVFPLYLYPDGGGDDGRLALESDRQPNYSPEFLQAVRTGLGMPVVDGRGDGQTNIGISEIFEYVLAVLHSPGYRGRYAGPLTRDFPRVPVGGNSALFRALVALGREVAELHLMRSPRLAQAPVLYEGPADPMVEQVSYADGTVWLDKTQTRGFAGVPEVVWGFHLGGYRVCEKWLKDRGPKKGKPGRVLTKHDIAHYQRIVAALEGIVRVMREIDAAIDRHGGWPGAFDTAS